MATPRFRALPLLVLVAWSAAALAASSGGPNASCAAADAAAWLGYGCAARQQRCGDAQPLISSCCGVGAFSYSCASQSALAEALEPVGSSTGACPAAKSGAKRIVAVNRSFHTLCSMEENVRIAFMAPDGAPGDHAGFAIRATAPRFASVAGRMQRIAAARGSRHCDCAAAPAGLAACQGAARRVLASSSTVVVEQLCSGGRQTKGVAVTSRGSQTVLLAVASDGRVWLLGSPASPGGTSLLVGPTPSANSTAAGDGNASSAVSNIEAEATGAMVRLRLSFADVARQPEPVVLELPNVSAAEEAAAGKAALELRITGLAWSDPDSTYLTLGSMHVQPGVSSSDAFSGGDGVRRSLIDTTASLPGVDGGAWSELPGPHWELVQDCLSGHDWRPSPDIAVDLICEPPPTPPPPPPPGVWATLICDYILFDSACWADANPGILFANVLLLTMVLCCCGALCLRCYVKRCKKQIWISGVVQAKYKEGTRLNADASAPGNHAGDDKRTIKWEMNQKEVEVLLAEPDIRAGRLSGQQPPPQPARPSGQSAKDEEEQPRTPSDVEAANEAPAAATPSSTAPKATKAERRPSTGGTRKLLAAYSRRDGLEYFSETHGRWCSASARAVLRQTDAQNLAEGRSPEATYEVWIRGVSQKRPYIAMQQLRPTFSFGSTIDLWSKGQWLPGEVCGPAIRSGYSNTYPVKLLADETGGSVQTVSSNLLRHRFVPGSRVLAYRGSDLGWAYAYVAEGQQLPAAPEHAESLGAALAAYVLVVPIWESAAGPGADGQKTPEFVLSYLLRNMPCTAPSELVEDAIELQLDALSSSDAISSNADAAETAAGWMEQARAGLRQATTAATPAAKSVSQPQRPPGSSNWARKMPPERHQGHPSHGTAEAPWSGAAVATPV
eukprot:TRINITY_DN19136_c0_g1_i1.p1 TRINITY_DN19136_c0_g1~~TRINITY_DN19136_c0_g1_i1.p1  ORF type:complete len:924 (+),score=184.95 TRINITY_DN19136_c0_g1_i1:80-2773(+)